MTARPAAFSLLALVLFGASVWAFWRFTVDDAYITMRYAQHLADGHGIRWNPGGDLVEGSTTFLWMLGLALLAVLKVNLVLGAKVLGVLCALATLPLVFRLVRDLLPDSFEDPASFAWLAVAWVVLTPETGWHAVSGMETAAFTLLVTLFGAQWVSLADARSDGAHGVALTALLLGLMRPDGNIIAVGTFGLALLMRDDARSPAFLRSVALYYVLPGFVVFLGRWLYFGQAVPATFAVKMSGALPGASGPEAVWAFCRHHGIAGLLALYGVAHTPSRTWPLWISLGLFGVFYLIPNHVMGYGFRFLAPLLPLLLALAVRGSGEALQALGARTRGRTAQVGTVALVGLLALQGVVLGRHWPRSLGVAWDYAAGLARAHEPLARQLKAVDPTGTSLLAVEDAGILSYLSEWRSLDLLGLNDATIAFEGFDPDDVLERNPDVVVLVSTDPGRYVSWGWNNLDLYPKLLADGLALTTVIPFRERDYHLFVLARPGSVAWNHLRRSFPSSLDPGA